MSVAETEVGGHVVASCSWRRCTHQDLGVWHHYTGTEQHDGSEYAMYFRKGRGLEGTTYVWMEKAPSQQWPASVCVEKLTTFASNVGFTSHCLHTPTGTSDTSISN